jgi:hypothetical protein
MPPPAPAETVTLRNQRPVMLPPMHLGHAEVCANSGTCLCHRQKVGVARPRPKRGRRVMAIEPRRFPSTLTLAAKGTEGDALTGLPLAVLHAASVKAAIASGAVKAERVPEPTPQPSSTAADAATPEKH